MITYLISSPTSLEYTSVPVWTSTTLMKWSAPHDRIRCPSEIKTVPVRYYLNMDDCNITSLRMSIK